MNKLDFITRQFSRAEKKRFEHYVVTRIWHLLNDLSIKFVTQQYVTRPEGRALTDMFFPQLQVHIEVDEGQHKNQIELDKLREADIINATGHEIIRVDVTQDIKQINQEIDEIVRRLREKRSAIADFKAWDLEAELDPKTYIKKGYIDLKDDVAFRTMVDAVNCFGYNYKPNSMWKGEIKHPKETGKTIWFPRLYKVGEWNNRISDDEMTIFDSNTSPEKTKQAVDFVLKRGIYNRIVFAKVKGPLGDIMYRFKGEYQLDHPATNHQDGLIWRRVSERVKTYTSSENQ